MRISFGEKNEKRLPEPELRRIPIKDIKFAPYQRDVKPTKVRKITRNFVPDVIGVALVSYRNGDFWCIDAQHRIKALEELGYTDILCQVITGLTYEQECYRFILLNTGRTQLTANQIFHGRVEEKDREALMIVRLFDEYNFDYNKNNSVKDNNVIGAVSKFVKMQKSYGTPMVDRVLNVLRNAWFGDKASLSSVIISGLATYFAQFPSTNISVLIKALEKIKPEMLIIEANAFVKCNMIRPERADSACYHIAKRIEQLYNDELNPPKRGKRKKAGII